LLKQLTASDESCCNTTPNNEAKPQSSPRPRTGPNYGAGILGGPCRCCWDLVIALVHVGNVVSQHPKPLLGLHTHMHRTHAREQTCTAFARAISTPRSHTSRLSLAWFDTKKQDDTTNPIPAPNTPSSQHKTKTTHKMVPLSMATRQSQGNQDWVPRVVKRLCAEVISGMRNNPSSVIAMEPTSACKMLKQSNAADNAVSGERDVHSHGSLNIVPPQTVGTNIRPRAGTAQHPGVPCQARSVAWGRPFLGRPEPPHPTGSPTSRLPQNHE